MTPPRPDAGGEILSRAGAADATSRYNAALAMSSAITTLPRRVVNRALPLFVQFAGTAAAFAVLSRASSALEVSSGMSPFFAAIGIGVVAAMQFGMAGVAGVAAGTALSRWGLSAAPPELLAAIAVNSFECAVPWLLFRFSRGISSSLHDLRSLAAFLLAGTVLNSGAAAVAGNLMLGPVRGSFVWREIGAWWISDFLSILLVAVPLITFGDALLARISGTGRRPAVRSIVNALQITAVTILLGWVASAATRNYLLATTEREWRAVQAAYPGTEQALNDLHRNYLQTAADHFGWGGTAPRGGDHVSIARDRHEAHLAALESSIVHPSSGVSTSYAILVKTSGEWFDLLSLHVPPESDHPELVSSHELSRSITRVRETIAVERHLRAMEISGRREQVLFASAVADGLVLAVILLASAFLVVRLSRPIETIHRAIRSMSDGTAGNLAPSGGELLELQALAAAIDDTSRSLAAREHELRLQTEKAKEASRHKSEFLAKMSHELRTPLNSIVGFTDLLLAQDATFDPARRRRFLENVSHSASNLLHLIDDLLDIARIESGKISFEYRNTDLREVVRRSVESITPMLERKGQPVELIVCDEPLPVFADARRIEQVLLNLISNANKYSASGEPVSVVARAAGEDCEIVVRDHGVGIDAADQKRVFADSQQLHRGGPRAEGAGLGLALARRFIDAHGGSIEVSSSPGEGSAFTIRIPRSSGSRQPVSSAAPL
jgi:signal transduction histidine kinase